jgi:type II secretory ATPase GspE/PulE/Tfp pilus assembly ATPase PilB-like protein/pSer/pThr/pTyr-binding forkhead associated (FHA) protein
MAEMSGPYLQVTTPQGSKQVPLGPQPLTVGRHLDNQLVITDNQASRFHCVIEARSGGWSVRDLNSSNGTLLDDKRITTSPLKPGQVILIGSTRLVIVDPSMKPAAPSRPPSRQTVDDEVEDLEEVDELEEVEELTDADVVAEEAEPAADTGAPVYRYDDDSPIRIEADSTEPAPPSGPGRKKPPADFEELLQTGVEEPIEVAENVDGADELPEGGGEARDFEATLESLAESLPERPFGEGDLGMISARGQVMHPPIPKGKAPPKKKRRDAVDVLRLVLVICSRAKATDIHLEPKTDHFQLRLRIDGLMVDVTKMPMDVGVKLSALVKVLSDIDISQRNAIQEGHFAAKLPGASGGQSGGYRRADYRVSFAPAVFGQKLVVRVFDAANAPLKVENLQLPDPMLEAVKRELQKESGMVLVCGPTGSGKTTTLYALLRSSDVTRRNVVTIEDPVEVQIEGVTQIQVDDAQGKTFSNLLRAGLRQDPDAILVGEIRDTETARIAMQAAITGHLVFSTVHTTNTIGSIFRLLDLGVEPYLVAQGLQLVLAQRLVRQLCKYCKKPVKPTAFDLDRMGPAGAGVTQIYEPRGCPKCLGTGFMGRRAFFELLRVTDELRDVITTTRTMEDIKRAVAAESKFLRLDQAGYQLVAAGATPLEEIDLAVGK